VTVSSGRQFLNIGKSPVIVTWI